MTNDVTKAPARPTWAAELNDQEMLFVAAYLDSLNATQAARAAGFAKLSANVQGHRLRRKPHVADAIAKALAERIGATRTRIIEEISRLAFSNVADVLTVENGQLVVKEHAELDRDTLSTVADVSEVVNEGGLRTLRVSCALVSTGPNRPSIEHSDILQKDGTQF
jgi:hypothetical protein